MWIQREEDGTPRLSMGGGVCFWYTMLPFHVKWSVCHAWPRCMVSGQVWLLVIVGYARTTAQTVTDCRLDAVGISRRCLAVRR